MGSTVCVRCDAPLLPYSYCDICDDILCFTCSSCSMITDERIHAYCRKAIIVNYNDSTHQDKQRLLVEPNSSQVVMDNNYINAHYYVQDLINYKIKDSSIELSKLYWFNLFESMKLINRCWTRILNIGNIGNTNSSIV